MPEIFLREGAVELVRRHALACHSRMMDLRETDRAAAVLHALAGAALFHALQLHAAPQPGWVAIHEEQCCRFGAIWIDSLIHQGHAGAKPWVRRGIQLLDRLEQLHGNPIPWTASMRASLLSRQISDRPDELRMLVVGNCQAYPLMFALRQALPYARIPSCTSVHIASAEDVARLHDQLPDADVLVMHRIQPGYRNGIGLDSDTLCALLSRSARTVLLPNLHYEGCHPWIAYARDPDQQLKNLEAESPLGPYHDFLCMAAAGLDLDIRDLLENSSPEPLAERIRRAHTQSLRALRQRERDCDVVMSGWIEEHHRLQPLAHTINHPAGSALNELLKRLLQHLGYPHQLPPDPFDGREPLGALTIPVHPWVRQALDLGPWAQRWGQRSGIPFPIAQQLGESLAFYRRHPWIRVANADHPRLRFAEECLSLLA